ncbi:hypothetical protein P5673_022929 [Acropora cervicornis]|uniref:Uncharacterized protein n=1 Tax=Acropora cervicornis TaxID=6130 RepID=A0AAD9UZB9_ACRCE|nr:hypothetical protein P5673_022929 [Acropora cervicornis]
MWPYFHDCVRYLHGDCGSQHVNRYDEQFLSKMHPRMWLESIDKGHVIPSPLNLLYYILKVITKVILMTCKTKRCCLCHCSCQKESEYFDGQEEIFQERLKTMKRLVVKFLEDRYIWDGKEQVVDYI